MIREIDGPWTAMARLATMDERSDAVIIVSRRSVPMGSFEAYRFPAGWRSGAIDRSLIPTRAKALARRVMNQLP